MVYSKDFDSAKEKKPQQGGRFASASDNIRNKARTAQLQGEKTFEVLDSEGNTIRYNTPGFSRKISVDLQEKLSVSDQAKVAADRSVVLREKLKLQARNQALQTDRQREQILKAKAIKDSKKNTVFVQSKVEQQKKKIAELQKQYKFQTSTKEQAKEKHRIDNMSRARKRRYIPASTLTRRSLSAASATLTSLENSLGKSQTAEKQVKKSASVFTPRRKSDTTKQKSQLKVNRISYYHDDTRPLSEQMKSPATSAPQFGPYIETQKQADVVNQNRQRMQDDKNRSRQITASKVVRFTGLDNIGTVKDIAKNIDTSFELGKLPKERSEKNIPIFGQDVISLPSPKKVAGGLSPFSNLAASSLDLIRSTKEHIKTGGKSGFIKDEKTGLPIAKDYYYKVPTALGKAFSGQPVNLKSDVLDQQTLGADVSLMAAYVSTGAGFGPRPTTSTIQKTPSVRPFPKSTPFGKKSSFTNPFPKSTLNEALKAPTKSGKRPIGFPKSTPFGKKSSFTNPFPKSSLNLGPGKTSPKDSSKGFEGSEFGLGPAIGFVIPKGQSKPYVPPKPANSFDTIGMNTKGGMISKPFFKEPKTSGKSGGYEQILKTKEQAFKSEKINLGKSEIKQLQQKQKSYSTKDDILHKSPKRTKQKSSSGYENGFVVIPRQQARPIISIFPKQSEKLDAPQIIKEASKPSQKQKTHQKITPVPFVGVIPKQDIIPKQDVVPMQGFVPVVPYNPAPQIQRPPQVVPPRGPGVFIPYIPKISLGSYGFKSPGAVKSGYAAFGISSDIQIKTLPTYSRYGKSSKVFAAQAKEDKKIQELFYGKKTKSKSKSKSASKKTNTKKKKKK